MSVQGRSVDHTVASKYQDSTVETTFDFQRSTQEMKSTASSSQSLNFPQEWVPIALRLPVALVFTLCLLLCVAILEIIDVRIKAAQGITERNQNQVRAIRYTPTVVAIFLGFAWRALVSDLKVITPWAGISKQWKATSSSVLLDYVDTLDIVSVWTAFRQRHWTLFIAGAGGLLAGALVPLANALTYVDLNAHLAFDSQLTKDTAFIFNGSLAMPVGWRSTQPHTSYLTAIYQDAENETVLPWVTTGMAFESYRWPGAQSFDNITITAGSTAFSAYLSCEPVQYTTALDDQDVNSTVTLQAHGDNCSTPISQQVKLPYNTTNVWEAHSLGIDGNWNLSTIAWSNITSCNGPEDWRILTTILDMQLRGNTTYLGKHVTKENATLLLDPNAKWNTSTAGLMCLPMYMLTPATVTVNGTTGWIMDFELNKNETRHIEIGISTELVHAQLETPLDNFSQKVFLAAATNDWQRTLSLPNSFNWSLFPELHAMQDWSWLYIWLTSNQSNGLTSSDPFFTYMALDEAMASRLKSDPELFAYTVNKHFSMNMAQLVHYGGRAASEGYIYGSIEVYDSRVFTRQASLRVLQGVLIALAIVAGCCATMLRPRTLLQENPASLGVVSVILASSPDVEDLFQDCSSCSDKTLKNKLKDYSIRLTRSAYGVPLLERTSRDDCRNTVVGDSERKATGIRSEHSQSMPLSLASPGDSLVNSATTELLKLGIPQGRYRPFALRLWNRWIIVALLVFAAGVVGALLGVSQERNGFQYPNSTASAVWAYVPTTILVLIGYGVQGMQSSVLSLQKFRALQSKKAIGRYVLIEKRKDIFFRGLRPLPRNVTVLWLCCLLLAVLFPAIMIVVGGLYLPEYAPYPYPGNSTYDRAPFDNFFTFPWNIRSPPAFSNLVGAEQASIFMFPDNLGKIKLETLHDLTIPLITTNFTAQLPQTGVGIDLARSSLDIRTIAIQTNINCIASNESDYTLMVTCLSDNEYLFAWQCGSGQCNRIFKPALDAVSLNLTILQDGNQTAANSWYTTVAYPNALDSSFTTLMTDFTNLTGQLNNLSSLCVVNGTTRVTQADLGVPLPAIQGAHCLRIMKQVFANVTYFPQPVNATLIVTTVGPWGNQVWVPRSYDVESLESVETLDSTNPPAIFLPNGGLPQLHFGPSLTPLINPQSFLALIGQSQEMRTGSALDLFDVGQLVASTKQVYELFSDSMVANMIAWMRDGTVLSAYAPPYPDSNITQVVGEFAIYRPVIKQDLGSSVALIVLLLVTAACAVCISVIMPRKTILPRAPSSIAAQLSFLAKSELVKRLREQGVIKTTDTDIWDEKVGLGWWPTKTHGLRWGIDIGTPNTRSTGLVAPENDPEDQDTSHQIERHDARLTVNDPENNGTLFEPERPGTLAPLDNRGIQNMGHEPVPLYGFAPMDGQEHPVTSYEYHSPTTVAVCHGWGDQNTSYETERLTFCTPVHDPQDDDASIKPQEHDAFSPADHLKEQETSRGNGTQNVIMPLSNPQDQDTSFQCETLSHLTDEAGGAETQPMLRHGEFEFERHEERETVGDMGKSMRRSFSAIGLDL